MYSCINKVIFEFIYTLKIYSVAEIGFMQTTYSVLESDSQFELCISIASGQSLNNGYGSATINIVTESATATG